MPKTNRYAGHSDDDLLEELERRKKEREKLKPPKALADPNWAKVITLAQEYVDRIEEGDILSTTEDMPDYIFEAVMTAIYGKQFWEWNNKKVK